MDPRFTSPSDLLEKVVENRAVDYVTLEEIKLVLHERGFALLAIIFAVVSLVTPPGLTMAPALPICLLSLQMTFGKKDLWMPRWLAKRRIKRALLARFIEKATPKLRRVEKLIRPRMTFLVVGPAAEKFIGAVMLIFALSIMVPLPLTNFLPGIGIILMCLGMVGRDGLQLLIGMLIGILGLTVTGMVLLFGAGAIDMLIKFIID